MPFANLQFDLSDRLVESGQVIESRSFCSQQRTGTMRSDYDGVRAFALAWISFMNYFNLNAINFYMKSLQRIDFVSCYFFKVCCDRGFSSVKDNFQINQPSFKEVISNVAPYWQLRNIEN